MAREVPLLGIRARSVSQRMYRLFRHGIRGNLENSVHRMSPRRLHQKSASLPGILPASGAFRRTRHGSPAAAAMSGISRVTTLSAPQLSSALSVTSLGTKEACANSQIRFGSVSGSWHAADLRGMHLPEPKARACMHTAVRRSLVRAEPAHGGPLEQTEAGENQIVGITIVGITEEVFAFVCSLRMCTRDLHICIERRGALPEGGRGGAGEIHFLECKRIAGSNRQRVL